MKRAIAIMMTALMAFTVATPLLGCGSEDDRSVRKMRIPRSRLNAKRLQDMSPEERAELKAQREKAITELMIWPEDKGPVRDVIADNEECRQRLHSKRALATANPLVQMTWMARCMEEKGWRLNPDAEMPQG